MNDQRKVLVKKLALVVDGRKDMELDLTGDLSQLKKQVVNKSGDGHQINFISKIAKHIIVFLLGIRY